MILPMKKVSVLVMDKSKEDSLRTIQDLGLIHLDKKAGTSPTLTQLVNRRTQLEIASGVLAGFAPKKKPKEVPPPFKGDLAARVISLSERRGKLLDYIFHHQREKGRFERWGEFNPKDFTYIVNHGVEAGLYELPMADYEAKTKDIPIIILGRDTKNRKIRFIAFAKIPGAEPWPMPERPLSVVDERDFIRKYEMSKLEEELTSLSLHKKILDDELKANAAEIEFETVQAGMDVIDCGSTVETGNDAQDIKVSVLSGYVPAEDMGTLKRATTENSWAICSDDPAEDDEAVPTKLKNSKFAQLLSPVTDFLELVPGYRETDITIWFLIFFTVFFGMIFGDAAYGLILFLIAVIGILKTAKKGVPLGFKFLFLMSCSNIVWGILVGTWFALDISMVPQALQNLSLPLIANSSSEPGWLATYSANNLWIKSGLIAAPTSVAAMADGVKTNLMLFCFSLALLQLSIAHIRNAIGYIKKFSLKILSEIGRMGLLFGMYFVVLSLIVYNTGFGGVQPWQLLCIGIGWVLIFVFGSFEGNLLKSIQASCSNIVIVILNITNVFSDIMSYIRLWAVGLAGAAIAGMINGAAVGGMIGNMAVNMVVHLVMVVGGVLFFTVGHGFNMVLNVLAVLVHAVRLNILEFSSHVGINWTGFAYKPFAKLKK